MGKIFKATHPNYIKTKVRSNSLNMNFIYQFAILLTNQLVASTSLQDIVYAIPDYDFVAAVQNVDKDIAAGKLKSAPKFDDSRRLQDLTTDLRKFFNSHNIDAMQQQGL